MTKITFANKTLEKSLLCEKYAHFNEVFPDYHYDEKTVPFLDILLELLDGILNEKTIRLATFLGSKPYDKNMYYLTYDNKLQQLDKGYFKFQELFSRKYFMNAIDKFILNPSVEDSTLVYMIQGKFFSANVENLIKSELWEYSSYLYKFCLAVSINFCDYVSKETIYVKNLSKNQDFMKYYRFIMSNYWIYGSVYKNCCDIGPQFLENNSKNFITIIDYYMFNDEETKEIVKTVIRQVEHMNLTDEEFDIAYNIVKAPENLRTYVPITSKNYLKFVKYYKILGIADSHVIRIYKILKNVNCDLANDFITCF